MVDTDENFYRGLISDIEIDPNTSIKYGIDSDYSPKLHPKQVPGKYWIDANACVFCSASTDEVPNMIRLEDDGVNFSAYIFRQPETPEEEADMRRAMEICPTEAIMDTGTDSVLKSESA
ncbi:MAG TPA: ferredoxin [Pyrinomonadaceae bacterium]|nr:ferredoxin [Pyrinomonadaceae bacterium]